MADDKIVSEIWCRYDMIMCSMVVERDMEVMEPQYWYFWKLFYLSFVEAWDLPLSACQTTPSGIHSVHSLSWSVVVFISNLLANNRVFKDQESESDSCTARNLKLLTNSTSEQLMSIWEKVRLFRMKSTISSLVLATFRVRLFMHQTNRLHPVGDLVVIV